MKGLCLGVFAQGNFIADLSLPPRARTVLELLDVERHTSPVLPNRADQVVHLTVAAGGGREQVPLPAKNQGLVLALDQGELRRQLNVDHQADASIQLEKGCGCLSGENLAKDGDILLAKLS